MIASLATLTPSSDNPPSIAPHIRRHPARRPGRRVRRRGSRTLSRSRRSSSRSARRAARGRRTTCARSARRCGSITTEDPLAKDMRRKVVWKFIPIHNVDAAAEGLDRRSAGGINLYFDWGFHAEEAAKLAKFKDDPSISTTDFSQPETRAAYDAIIKFKPNVFLDVHSWHFSGDGFWGPDPAASSVAIDALKKSIAKYFKIQRWDHEAYRVASAPTIATKLGIAATLPEFALSFDSDKTQKTTASLRRQGVEVLRGTFEYLEGL